MPYRRLGSTDRLSTTVRDVDGNLVDPGDILLRLRDPARVVTTIDYNPGPIARDGQGQYHYDVANLATLGDYAWLYKTTGIAQGITENPKYFTLVDEFTPILITLGEAKSQIGLRTTDVPDADLERFIDAASTQVEMWVGQRVVPRTVTRTASVSSSGTILLPHCWVVPGSVTAATAGGSAVDVSGWTLLESEWGARGIITTPVRYWGTVTVSYTAGFDPIPETLRESAALLVQNAMESQRGAAELPLAEDVSGVGPASRLYFDARDKAKLLQVPTVA